ncbi:PAN domain [Popillia japonica]|uniref:PAN domain n=1 Tax=Popillia japonica TaxID=7064 RepID=A0AAW1LV97_POPJA
MFSESFPLNPFFQVCKPLSLHIIGLTMELSTVMNEENELGKKNKILKEPIGYGFKEPYHRPTTLQCIEKCGHIDECTGFILDYKTSACYWYRSEISFDEGSNDIDENVALFIKTCLNVQNCTKIWIFERSPGATLVGNDKKTLPTVVTRQQCQQSCLDETSFDCRSAKFTLGHRNGSEIVGRCVLSDTDRHVMTSSFRVSRSDEEYFDNQCSKNLNETFCPYEEYDNIILSHSDVLHENKTKEECENLCQNSQEFNCRGYSIWPLTQSATNTRFICLIHSEDSKLLGPKLLADKTGSTHFEKAPCLNLSVTCPSNEMVIKYTPNVNFYGKIYLKGYSENQGCYVKGHGLESLILRFSLQAKQCGVQQAISNTNR